MRKPPGKMRSEAASSLHCNPKGEEMGDEMKLPLVSRNWPNLWTFRSRRLRSLCDLQFAGIRQALTRFPRTPRTKVLDFGAGTSPYRDVLPPHGLYFTLDPHLPEADFRGFADVRDLHFDLILAAEVLEHVEDPLTTLKSLAGLLSENGEIWVTVPFIAREHPAPDDFTRWTAQGLRRLFENAGLEILELQPRGNDATALAHLIGYLAFRFWLRPVTWPLALVLTALTPLALALGHLSLRWPFSPAEGPLGYALRARRQP